MNDGGGGDVRLGGEKEVIRRTWNKIMVSGEKWAEEEEDEHAKVGEEESAGTGHDSEGVLEDAARERKLASV